MRRTYGLDDESAKNIDEGKKQDVVRVVMDLFDQNKDGGISRQEFVEAWMGAEAKRLPDFGVRVLLVIMAAVCFLIDRLLPCLDRYRCFFQGDLLD